MNASHITHKFIKLNSVSEWAGTMRFVNIGDRSDPALFWSWAEPMLRKFVAQIQRDEAALKAGDITAISDAAVHAPRFSSSINKPPFRIAYFCTQVMFQETGRISVELHAKIHWQRLISRLSRAYLDEQKKQVALKAEFKVNRLLGHQRKNWCELKKRTIQKAVGKPQAMPVDIAPLEELQPFLDFLKSNRPPAGEQEQFTRGTMFADGRMDLCKQVVGPTWIGRLLEALKDNTRTQHFLLGNNITGLEGGKAIHAFLTGPHAPHIQTWYLAGQDYTAEALRYIAGALEFDGDVESLWLKRNPLYAESAPYLRRLLERNCTLKILDLHNTALGLRQKAYESASGFYEDHLTNDGVRDLCEGLKMNTTLRHLYLDANALGTNAATSLASVFRFKVEHGQKGIHSLWINMNRLYDSGTIELVNSLREYPIKRLIMGSNMISDLGMRAISNAFQDHKTLRLLDLSLYKSTGDMGAVTNNIGDDGKEAIAALLRKNSSIQYLNISMNNISADAMEYIVETGLAENRTILWFVYSQYGVEMPQALVQRINAILTRNRSQQPDRVFDNTTLRHFRHGRKINKIDSIYRNNMK